MTCDARFERYRDLLPVDQLRHMESTVIGVGAIGRQATIQLATTGVERLQLIDPDVVAEANLGPQGFGPQDIGDTKVHATATAVTRLNPNVVVDKVCRRFRRRERVFPVVFCCVDSIEARRFIWNAVQHDVNLFIDGRMTAETLRVITASARCPDVSYADTLFEQRDAYAGGCTTRSTFYCATIAAGLMVAQFTKWLRRMPLDADITFNLLAMDIAVTGLTAVASQRESHQH